LFFGRGVIKGRILNCQLTSSFCAANPDDAPGRRIHQSSYASFIEHTFQDDILFFARHPAMGVARRGAWFCLSSEWDANSTRVAISTFSIPIRNKPFLLVS
jgi:hypothetical protein